MESMATRQGRRARSRLENGREGSVTADDRQLVWDRKYRKGYGHALQEISQFGRHGVLAEFINRLLPTGRVLDVGCGPGILPDLLDPTRFEYVGFDISANAIAEARSRPRRSANVQFQVARWETFRSDEKFDAVVFNEVLTHVDADSALTCSQSWLRPSRLVLSSSFERGGGTGLRCHETLKRRLSVLGDLAIESPVLQGRWLILLGHL
jgi:2-polyprenyl-3-methyl-5-hydroxy-6-metoxy-1,4-benzoquinol methylase